MSIFGRLNFDTGSTAGYVQPLSNAAINQINTMPQLLNSWQQADVANSAVSGYFQNPLITVLNEMIYTANQIVYTPGLANTENLIYSTANTLVVSTIPSFIGHTNRLSGVEPIMANTATLPHYSTAINIGKTLQYIMYQSDGIQNNAPIIGNFTSLFTGNTLNTMLVIMQNDANTVNNSVNSTLNISSGLYTYGSNLTPTQANTIAANLQSVITLMTTRQNYDVNFYYNSQSILNDYNTVKPLGNMGQTETELTTTLVGSPKLLSRINS